MMMRNAVKVNREKVSACLTCPLCSKLFTNATTISECLHTFCRECINKKLIDEKLSNCPVCNADLGCLPLDKLRTDHSLQDLRDKILPVQEKSAKALKNVASDKLLTKRKKKKSLYSLKDNARGSSKAAARKAITPQEPDVSSSEPQKVAEVKKDERHRGIEILDEVSTILSARRAKAAARKKFIPREFAQTDKVTGDEKRDDGHSRLETTDESSQTRVQNSPNRASSQQIVPNNILVDSDELWKETADMCRPLNSLVEAARKNKSSNKSTMQGNAVVPVPVDSNDNVSQAPFVEAKKQCLQIKATGDQDEPNPSKPDSIKLKWLQGTQERPLRFSEDLNVPAQPVAVTSDGKSNKEFSPIWFSLVASEEKDAGAQLPQISPCYLRVKDGSLPVSFVKMYIAKKLGLASEAEVEISLRGKPVLPSVQLQNLVDMWLQTKPKNEKVQTYIGSSAKDLVMVLSYCRKA